MNKFIRTKEGFFENRPDICIYIQDNILWQPGYDFGRINLGEVIKQADTIEELIMPGDMLVVDNKQNQMPIFVESLEYLKSWLYCHDIYKIKEILIKKGNNWNLVAKINENGKLELFPQGNYWSIYLDEGCII